MAGDGGRGRSVSGSSQRTAAAAMVPARKMKRKQARQPKAPCSRLPISGATIGASPMIIAMRESSRPARAPS